MCPCLCRFCPAAVFCRTLVFSDTAPTSSLLRPSCCCVRKSRVTATRRMQKTVTVQYCWSTPAHATPTGYFFRAGSRRANAVSVSVQKSSSRLSIILIYVFFVKFLSVPLGCSTVCAPSLAPQLAIVSTSRRSARRSVWTDAHALVTSLLYLSFSLCLSNSSCNTWLFLTLCFSG